MKAPRLALRVPNTEEGRTFLRQLKHFLNKDSLSGQEVEARIGKQKWGLSERDLILHMTYHLILLILSLYISTENNLLK